MPDLDELYPSKWLKASDLKGQSFRMTIVRVTIEDVGDHDRKPVMWLDGSPKGVVLNRTNADSVGLVHGRNTDYWGGKMVELYPQAVPFQGQTVPAIRMRGIPCPPVTQSAVAGDGTQQAPILGGPTLGQPQDKPFVGAAPRQPGPGEQAADRAQQGQKPDTELSDTIPF